MSEDVVMNMRWLGDQLSADAESQGIGQGSEGARYCWEAARLIESQAAQIAVLREALEGSYDCVYDLIEDYIEQYGEKPKTNRLKHLYKVKSDCDRALAATPSDALNSVIEKVKEECAKVCDREPLRNLSDYDQGCKDMANDLAETIRALEIKL